MTTNGTFVNIQDWMLEYDLDLTETVIFAMIHTFSMNGRCRYDGSRRYLAFHAKCSTDKVDKSLKKLRDMGLIMKTEIYREGVKFCEYVSTVGSRYEQGVAAGSGRGEAVGNTRGSRPERHNNKEDNIDNKTIDSNTRTRVENATPINKKKSIFDFGKALVEAGASEANVARLLEIRKAKRLSNTQKAYDLLIESIHTICQMQGVTTDEVVAFMVNPQQNWGAIRPDWAGVERIKPNVKRSMKTMTFEELVKFESRH